MADFLEEVSAIDVDRRVDGFAFQKEQVCQYN